MLDTVLTALRSGDHAGAAQGARALLAAEPDHAEAHHLLGLALHQLGELEAAQAAFERALALAPEHAPYHVSLAMLATTRRDAAAARGAFGAALALDPNTLLAYIGLAELALGAADLAQAEQHLRYAERINPEHPHVLMIRGQVQLAQGDAEAGMAALTRAATLAPQDALVQSTFGLALLARGHHAFAEQALRNTLALQPDSAPLRHALLQAILAQGRAADAEAEADTLLQRRPDDAGLLLLKGRFLAARNELDAAAQTLRRALERDPRQPQALDALLGVLLAADRRAEAQACVDDLLIKLPNADFVWAAQVELLRDEPRQAADAALRWQQARPDSAAANELAAQIAEAAGELARAREFAQRAVARTPQRNAAQLILARAELRDGDGAAARARLQPLHAQARDPRLRRALAGWLGRACDAVGDAPAAVRAWSEAQRLLDGERSPPPPPLTLPDAALEARVADALATPVAIDAAQAPTLLWGAPGSGVEQIAAWLRAGSEALVLGDRFSPTPRDDGFALAGIGSRAAATPDEAAQRFAQRWRDGLASIGADARDIDWLPHWDARLLPPLVRGLPGARMLVVLRDPRDLLLNWLAFGAPQRLPMSDPKSAAQWLALALEQLAFLANRTQPALRVLWMEQLDDASEATLAGHAQFLGLAQSPPSAALQRARFGAGGLPTAFPAGHWRRYAEPLRDAFAELEPIARRLGGG